MTKDQFNNVLDILLSVLIVSIAVTIMFGIILIVFSNLNIVNADVLDIETDDIIDEPVEPSNNITLEDKYSSVFEWQVYTGDFDIEQLYYLETQCSKYEIPMEIMLAIICTESSFRSYAQASTSSASGYCQIIKGTAKWVYEDLLKYGTYDTDVHRERMTTDWELNIELGCRLLYCLYWNSNASWESAIQKYYGGGTEANLIYLNKVNSNMFDLFGMTTSNFQ